MHDDFLDNMPLTRDQRHTAYIILKEEVEYRLDLGHSVWFCIIMEELFDIEADNDDSYGNFQKYFPELWKQRVAGRTVNSVSLWNSNTQRVQALEEAIKETE